MGGGGGDKKAAEATKEGYEVEGDAGGVERRQRDGWGLRIDFEGAGRGLSGWGREVGRGDRRGL